MRDRSRRRAPPHTRVAADDEDRARIWKGRKSAFSAVGRLSPDFIVQDGVVPRARLGEALAAIEAMSRAHGIRVANVFHAGDGNLHPLILYDGREAGAHDRAEVLAAEILRLCIRLGGSITGEHGVGLEKRAVPRRDVQRGRPRLHAPPACGDGSARSSRIAARSCRTPRAGGISHGLHPLERAGDHLTRMTTARPTSIDELAAMVAAHPRWQLPRRRHQAGALVGAAGCAVARPLGPRRHRRAHARGVHVHGAGRDTHRRHRARARATRTVPAVRPATRRCRRHDRRHGRGGRERLVPLSLRRHPRLPDRRAHRGRPRAASSHSGGKVVKNAAGFLLHQAMVGSAGRFGVLAELTFKVFPAPRRTRRFASTPAISVGALRVMSAVQARALRARGRRHRGARAPCGCGSVASPRRCRRGSTACSAPAGAPSDRLEGEADAAVWRDAREFTWMPPGASLVRVPLTAGQARGTRHGARVGRCTASLRRRRQRRVHRRGPSRSTACRPRSRPSASRARC